MSEITLNRDQQKIYDEIESTTENCMFFVEGAPGTGKTTFGKEIMKTFAKKFPMEQIKIASFSGIAASNATSGTDFKGQTIHSLFKIGNDIDNMGNTLRIKTDIAADISVLFLDEVSIGHALISDALYLGLEKTIESYKNCLIN